MVLERANEHHSHDVIGPEELVRRETKVVNLLRAILLAILITTAALLSVGSYKMTSKWEEEAYRKSFDVVSQQFKSSFHAAMASVMWNAYIIGVAASASTNVGQAPFITIPMFDKIPFAVIALNHVTNIFFAPLLHDETELRGWEEYAQQQWNNSDAGGTESTTCDPCGSPDLESGTPDVKVELPIGTFTCADLTYAAVTGALPAGTCPLLVQYIMASCACRPTTTGSTASFHTAAAGQTQPRSSGIFEISGNETKPVQGPGPFLPIWQVYPPKNKNAFVFYDLLSDPIAKMSLDAMMKTKTAITSKTFDMRTPNLWNVLEGDVKPTWGNLLFSPVYGNDGVGMVGSIVVDFDFQFLIGSSVPVESDGIDIVLENSCGQQRTFRSDGSQVNFVGNGDRHEPKYEWMKQSSSFEDYSKLQIATAPNYKGGTSEQDCTYRVLVYSSDRFRSTYISNKPRIYAMSVFLMFVFTSLVFITYDCYVARRQRNLMEAALQRDEIVSSLFPAVVRARLFGIQQPSSQQMNPPPKKDIYSHIVRLIRPNAFMPTMSPPSVETSASHALVRSEPIADFLPMVSIVFADISGFTAWSSEREPSQVFQLLETVYQTFDRIALQCGVFKVETIGDCYVAAACIPVYQPDHAVRIVKFAHSCLLHMHELIHELEATLGPSTASLSIRIGVHSGPVIAGVLRGEKSRFQLFGDTMNTAARMQTSCEINMIQLSTATANLLKEANMSSWIRPRNEPVALKGKGVVQTYWVDPVLPRDEGNSNNPTMDDAFNGEVSARTWGETRLSDRLTCKISADDKRRRMVEWNTELLMRFLKKVVASRTRSRPNEVSDFSILPVQPTPFAEATEILAMPSFLDRARSRDDIDGASVDLGDTVRSQLQDYIDHIAFMYKDNPFHNFEHACHVAMSAAKIVMRIIRPDVESPKAIMARGKTALKRKIHHSTFGISSDFMMQFAVVFSAVIHDVDHTGVSNAQLVRESQEVAIKYDNKCVAEQNSVDIAWDLLMQDRYTELRRCICPTALDQQRFRQLLVNAVIATDIADRELQLRRKNRWDRAFHYDAADHSDDKNDLDRKATIVFEYIIQASDVSHTMQHWKVYKQWNERLFEERYRAFQSGREEHDPSIGWYKGELWFFDNYIIPLAKKLETCGVFGVSSDEYLSYALENRHEWELKGEDIVRDMINNYVLLKDCLDEHSPELV